MYLQLQAGEEKIAHGVETRWLFGKWKRSGRNVL